jgi:hypothetical protein
MRREESQELADARKRWRAGIPSETQFWDDWFRTKGLQWPTAYRNRLDPDFPLQPRPEALLPPEKDVHILDVCAGPLTYLGKKALLHHLVARATNNSGTVTPIALAVLRSVSRIAANIAKLPELLRKG